MEIYQIRYFLAVSETLNFTRAAERCFVSQPALTKAIQRLEELLGGRLFDRTKSGLQLTELGRAMLPNFQQIDTTAKQTREQARRLLREQRVVIRVGMMCSLAFKVLLPGFLAFQSGESEVCMQFYDGTAEALTDALDRNEVDIAVVAAPYGYSKRFRATTLFREDYVIAHGPGHRFTTMTEVSVRDLNGEAYCERLNCEYSYYIDETLRDLDVTVETVHASHREDWIQSLVGENIGIAYMPLSLARAAGVPFIRTPDCPFVREVKILELADRPQSDAISGLIATLVAFRWPEDLAEV
ncbi:hypothetical protein WL35_26595 [Burkholderia ubonensis]|uniref:LysR family transcriptional regulator n=1 Tax=Burkholderia ubonensis TaxID=101571 RepID=UPI0007555A5F|nr:LysR family transcriptional regulator [Burkholderia ubonensis]KWB55744.1 hypothetical protein WL35_26595 [Burkholderia ubonensis]